MDVVRLNDAFLIVYFVPKHSWEWPGAHGMPFTRIELVGHGLAYQPAHVCFHVPQRYTLNFSGSKSILLARDTYIRPGVKS